MARTLDLRKYRSRTDLTHAEILRVQRERNRMEKMENRLKHRWSKEDLYRDKIQLKVKKRIDALDMLLMVNKQTTS